MLIEKLQIENLKSIKNMTMECSSLNLLIGTNSSGKSSVLQGFLLFAQNMELTCGLNGTLISLGSFAESRCLYEGKKDIKVSLGNGNEEMSMFFGQTEDGKLSVAREASSKEVIQLFFEGLSIKTRRVQYLSNNRIGPQNVYAKNMTMEDEIGSDGQYAVAFLNEHHDDVVEPDFCKGNMDYTLLGQVNWWLSYIADTVISTEEIVGADLVKANYTMYDVLRIRPTNIGSGISYLISVLIVCLSSPKDSVIVLENPEIHLHPSAQAKLCEFLYFVSGNRRQLFIESHSDHVFNGFRAGIAAGEMKKEAINIQFISLNDEHVSQAMKVRIGRMGRVENQKKNLFDQFDLDLNKMIGLPGRRNGTDFK
ncbi:MAG: AAA family ATPase [Lachnospiraceae bacterium]|jgi:predicted ATPase|nr:AAA family ATPase [Lachnospiraceae bacterium]